MRQSEKIKYMLTTELTEDELKNVIHYSFSNRPIDTKLWSELLDKLDLTDEDITTDFHDKIKNLVYDAFIIKRIDYDVKQNYIIQNTGFDFIFELLNYDILYFNTYGTFFNCLYS